MTYELCGDCLHARTSHTQIKDIFHCAVCNKLCEKVQYFTDHSPSGLVIQDGTVFKTRMETKK